MKRIFLLFILFFILYSCEIKFDNFIDDPSYKIHYNNNWNVEKNEIDNIEFYLTGNDTLNKFCNINLNIQNYTENTDFKTYVEKVEKQLNKKEKLLSSKYKSGSKLNYQEMIFEKDYGEFSLLYLQRFILKDLKVYVLTFTCEKDYFYENINDVNNIFDTFIIK